MKAIFLKTVVFAASLSAIGARASLDFASLPGSAIEFSGSSHQFNFTEGTSSAYEWQIASPGPAEYLQGSFTGGPWTYGQVATLQPGLQVATVIGPLGGFFIDDGAGHTLTGDISWASIETFQAIGGLNADASINISNMKYGGANTALLDLIQGGNGSVDLSFQFNPTETLWQVSTGTGPYFSESYSGSFAAAPEPSTWFAGCASLLILASFLIRRHGAASRGKTAS